MRPNKAATKNKSKLPKPRPPQPLDVIAKGNAQAAAQLRLADLLYGARDYERTQRAAAHVLALSRSNATKPPLASEQISYAHFLRGRALYGNRDTKLKMSSMKDYLAAHKTAPKAPWAGQALFWPATSPSTSSAIGRKPSNCGSG